MTIFLVLGVVGLVLLALSLLLGDLFGGALDALSGDVFSSAAIGGFVSALGFGAALSESLGASLWVAVIVGVAVGLGFGWFASWLTRLVRGGGSDATVSTDDAVGRDAKVLTAIPEGGFGVVRVQVGGHSLQLNARAERAVEVGTEVYVTAVLSPTAVAVAPVREELA